MATELQLGVRLTPEYCTTIKLTNVNLQSKVEELKTETAQKINIPKDSFEFIYRGCILDDGATLESCGLTGGAMVHVLKKKNPEVPLPGKSISETSVVQFTSTFHSFNENHALRSALHRLSKRPEVIENIISSSPGLSEDSVAVAMLQDPDLMAHFEDPDTVRRIAELHPVLFEAARHLAAVVHEEAVGNASADSAASTSTAQHTTAYSYSLDNLSDDEEMAGDSSQSSDSAQHIHPSGNRSISAITSAQLATAISRVNARTLPLSASSSSTSGDNSNSAIITSEMFNQAMRQAFATVSDSPVNIRPDIPQLTDMQRQLAQMHELGLQDDAMNIQALQYTNGDVQAAIDLLFSGSNDN